MFSFGKIGLAAGVVLLAATGCETVDRARVAQRSVASVTNDVQTVSTNAPAHVNLVGLRLVDYVAWAMDHRPSIESAHLAVSNAVLELTRVASERELHVDLSGGYSQSSLNTGSHFSWRQHRGKGTADISIDLLIYDFGRIDAQERRARENLVAAQRDLADEEFAVFQDVSQAYFTLLRNDALLEVARTNEFQYAEHRRQAESLFAEGEVKKLDVLKARVDLSDARLATINASNDVVTAGAEFIRSLGLSSDRATRNDVLKAAKNALETMKSDLTPTTYGAVDALALARTNAPALKVLRAKLRAASAEVDYAIADLMPSISLSSAFSFADPTWNWSWGFRAIQTLLDGYRKRTAVDQAVVAMEQARVAVAEAEQRLSHDLAVAAANRDNARESLATAKIEVDQARENLETVIQQYKLGDASRIDFTDAAGGFASALGARVKAFYAGEVAEAELIRLTGTAPEKKGAKKDSEVKKGSASEQRKTGTYREVNDDQMD